MQPQQTLDQIFKPQAPAQTASTNMPVAPNVKASLDSIFGKNQQTPSSAPTTDVKSKLDSIFHPVPEAPKEPNVKVNGMTPDLGIPANQGIGVVDLTKPIINGGKDVVDSIGKEFGGGPDSVGSKLINDVSEGAKDIQKGDVIKGVVKAGGRTAGDVAGAIFTPIASVIGAITKEVGLNKLIDKVGTSYQPILKSLTGTDLTDMKSVQDFAMKHPNAGADFERILNLFLSAGEKSKIEPDRMLDEGKKVIDQAKEQIPQKIDTAIETVKNINPIQTAKETVFGKPEKQIANMTKEWTEPAKTNTSGNKRVVKVLAKDPTIPQFLSEQGLDPKSHIEDGKYSTKETAIDLKDTAGKMSREGLRPALKDADYYTPKTPVIDLKPHIIEEIKRADNITPGNESAIEAIADKEIAALEKKFPMGMSLTDMHDYKITYSKNAGYSPVNDPLVNNTATANRSISSVLQKAVETKAPPSIPVAEFNKYLSKYYKAADYLDAIDTKKVPVGPGTKIIRATAKATGTMVGAHFGGLPTEFAGYSLGGALEHAVENMPNPVRTQFLNSLQKTNPEAFNRVQTYLGDAKTRMETQPKLPAGSEKGTEKNPIITPTPSEEVQQKGRANEIEKNQDFQNSQAIKPNSKNINAIDSNDKINSEKTQPSNAQKVLSATPLLLTGKNKDMSVQRIKDELAFRESGLNEQKDQYNTVNKDTKDIGKYQVNPKTLESYGKKFLGKVVSVEEFLKSPKLQEKFMEKEIEHLSKLGAKKLDSFLVLHHFGWGNIDSSRIKQLVKSKEGQKYLNNLRNK